MTDGLEEMIRLLGGSYIFKITFYTAPSGPSSINNNDDAMNSAMIVFDDLDSQGAFDKFDAFLVACYSVHPLVSKIRERVGPSVPVTGIFEASIGAALMLLSGRGDKKPRQTFGIISTGSYWEIALTEGVLGFFSAERSEELKFFKGVRTTGLNATELHEVDQEVVKSKIKKATRSLLRERDCSVIILGCAGMSGMDEWVQEAVIDELGTHQSEYVTIVDGVKAGIVYLEGAVKIFPRRTAERSS